VFATFIAAEMFFGTEVAPHTAFMPKVFGPPKACLAQTFVGRAGDSNDQRDPHGKQPQ
jgi:hypothetical protein